MARDVRLADRPVAEPLDWIGHSQALASGEPNSSFALFHPTSRRVASCNESGATLPAR